MYDLQISIERVLTPEEGQEKLKQLGAAIKDSTGWTKVVVPGANVHENPFPEWLNKLINDGIPEVKFDDINYIFHRRFDKVDEGLAYIKWLEELKQWMRSDESKAAVAETVRYRIFNTDVDEIVQNNIESF